MSHNILPSQGKSQMKLYGKEKRKKNHIISIKIEKTLDNIPDPIIKKKRSILQCF